MDVDDRVVLTTPEGVDVELVLAGLGSRFSAAMIDWLLRAAVLLGIALVAQSMVDGFSAAFAVVTAFLVVFGYDVLFEVLHDGRTPGKRACGIRVVDRNGGPVHFVPSVVRNLLRIVDLLPSFYLVGSIALLVSPRNQRLGDLAAGTYVIRERRMPLPAAWTVSTAAVDAPPALAGRAPVDLGLVTPHEVATVRRFLERRRELLPDARRRLAADLAGRLRPKIAGIDDGDDEQFLEQVVAAMSR